MYIRDATNYVECEKFLSPLTFLGHLLLQAFIQNCEKKFLTLKKISLKYLKMLFVLKIRHF